MIFVTRAQWEARPPKYRNTSHLTAQSTAHWNGPVITIGGNILWEHDKCASLVRGIQNYHMDAKGWSDIAYNYVVCPHGCIFEGRGLNTINGANGTTSGNRSSHAIMALAGEGNPFTDNEKIGFRNCVMYIANMATALEGCKGHRDHKPTVCPGDERYNWVRQGMPGLTTPPRPPESDLNPTLKLGSTGAAVSHVQLVIRDKAGGDISVDGIFGPNTERRVKDIQRFFKLTVDGIVGPKTWGVINFLATMKILPFGDWPRQRKPQIKFGTKSMAVTYLQNVIFRKAGGDIQIDGVFGLGTERRVKDVQRFFKLNVDGIVGERTWGIIDYLATH